MDQIEIILVGIMCLSVVMGGVGIAGLIISILDSHKTQKLQATKADRPVGGSKYGAKDNPTNKTYTFDMALKVYTDMLESKYKEIYFNDITDIKIKARYRQGKLAENNELLQVTQAEMKKLARNGTKDVCAEFGPVLRDTLLEGFNEEGIFFYGYRYIYNKLFKVNLTDTYKFFNSVDNIGRDVAEQKKRQDAEFKKKQGRKISIQHGTINEPLTKEELAEAREASKRIRMNEMMKEYIKNLQELKQSVM